MITLTIKFLDILFQIEITSEALQPPAERGEEEESHWCGFCFISLPVYDATKQLISLILVFFIYSLMSNSENLYLDFLFNYYISVVDHLIWPIKS